MTTELLDLAARVLGLSPGQGIGDASLLELGGNSIKAMMISAHAEEQWGLELSIDTLLEPRPLREVLAEAA